MKKYTYTPKPLFYALVGSLILSVFFSPIIFGIVAGVWFFYALINLGNRINKDNGC